MIASGTIISVISTYGIALLAPVAVMEGPIVSVVAGYLAHIGLFPLWQVIFVVILADVLGDCLLYGVGRGMLKWLPLRWREKVGVSDVRLELLAQTFREKGARVLVVGKLTHAAGFAILLGAGAARMRFGLFVLANLLATIPKSLVLVAIGYVFGSQHERIAEYFSTGSLVILGIFAAALGVWYWRRRATSA
ncbi:MAG: VTT domain-containing protein [Rhodobacterales bacterium]|jgi:membrane-associated protein|nr:VTT domain-containing protein [Rhodobacterales bacterium]